MTRGDLNTELNKDLVPRDGVDAWINRRGGSHIFPVSQGLIYREFAGDIGGEEWGEGLLDKLHFAFPPLKVIPLPDDFSGGEYAEVFLISNGRMGRQSSFNDREFSLYTPSELATGYECYSCIGNSVHRNYHLAEVPIEMLKAGENHLGLEPTHAYVQTAVLRIFSASDANPSWCFEVEQEGENIRLLLKGSGDDEIRQIQFFVRMAGMDLDLSGQTESWQAVTNHDLSSLSRYEVASHCGSSSGSSCEVVWRSEFIPSGPLEFRCRIETVSGWIIESPGGFAMVDYKAPCLLKILRPTGFSPIGFHENGWQQDVNVTCDYDRIELSGIKRAILRVPLYGDVSILFNDQYASAVSAPTEAYYIREVEVPLSWLREGLNTIKLNASGGTGCFQAPGPFLYLFYGDH